MVLPARSTETPGPLEPVSPPIKQEPVYSTETVDLSLKQLWPKLGAQVIEKASAPPGRDALLRLPLNLVQAHLAKGAFKIPFAQLRQFSPKGLFAPNPESDAIEVTIPIEEILPGLKAEHLARRAGQKKIDIPDDIEPIFGPNGGKSGAIRIAAEKARPVTPAPRSEVAPAPTPEPEPISAFSPDPAKAAAALPATAPVIPPLSPRAPLAPSEPIRATNVDPSLATLRPKPAPAVPDPHPRGGTGTFNLALMDVATYWSEKGHDHDLGDLYRHSLEMPLSILEPALKKGKLLFDWKELRQWIRQAPGVTLPNIPDDKKVELPLSIVAPRFLEQLSSPRTRKQIEVSSEIPDVFARHTPAPGMPEPSAPTDDGANGPRDFGQIFSQPDKSSWSLGEVSEKTAALPGIAGALIATSDGLLVAGNWPEGVGTDAVAAFVPQIYSRVAKYSSELRLGTPGHFTLLIENVPLQIFKTADSYFTVLGRAGETLPSRELTAIATCLAATSTQN